jgi:hypothetical protein
MTNTTGGQRLMCITGALMGWFALIAQLCLIIENRAASLTETILRYFGFFTILTNILVALCFTFLLTGKSKFFHKKSTQTAIAVYILVVGAVYNLVLRFLWQPQGLQWLVDELLHTVIPLFYLCHWFIHSSKQALPWKNALPWLLYPLVYICYTLIRGSIVHFYPYPFLDVDVEGYPSVLIACLLLTFAFLGLALLFIAITRIRNKKVIA